MVKCQLELLIHCKKFRYIYIEIYVSICIKLHRFKFVSTFVCHIFMCPAKSELYIQQTKNIKIDYSGVSSKYNACFFNHIEVWSLCINAQFEHHLRIPGQESIIVDKFNIFI